MSPTYAELQAMVRGRGLAFFNQGAFNLNLVVLRSTPGKLDAYDDVLCCAYRGQDGQPRAEAWACTADPVAQLALGPHRRALALGQHRGLYRCLAAPAALPCSATPPSPTSWPGAAPRPPRRGSRYTARATTWRRPWARGPRAAWCCPGAAGLGDRYTITVLEKPRDL